MGTGSFPEVKGPGCDVDHPSPPSAEVKERVELYICFPSGPSWPIKMVKFADLRQEIGEDFMKSTSVAELSSLKRH